MYSKLAARALGIALVVSFISSLLSSPALAATAIDVVGPNVNLRPGTATPAGAGPVASLSAARNEFESFQIAITPDATIQNLTLELAAPPTKAGGASIPTSNVTFYREGYHTVVSNQTIDTRTDGESSAGAWPDVLIPQRDYIFGEDRAAFHAPVGANERVVVWVDVLVPADQAPGSYAGTINVKDGATSLGLVQLNINVRDFTIPSTSSLQNQFLTNYGQPCIAHTPAADNDPADDFSCDWNSELAWRLHALYARVALENRVTISNPWPIGKAQTLTNNSYGEDFRPIFHDYILPLIKGTATPASLGSQVRLPGAQLTILSLLGPSAGEAIANACGTVCVDSWKTRATADGFLNKLLYYTCDEPFLDATRWSECDTTHDNVSGPSGLPELVTGPIQQAQAANLGNGADAWIDVMVPLLSQMANKPGSPFHAGNQRPAYNAWLAGGADGVTNRLWIYSACNSGGCNGKSSPDQDPAWNHSYWDGWGGYGIDQPASQARSLSWLAFEYGASGELYWHTTNKLPQAWNDCTQINNNATQSSDCIYDSGMTGDGTLFYPGKACPLSAGDPACIGGTAGKDIPLETIRLKRIRDGREDYEYLNILATRGDAADDAFAHSTALGLFGPDLNSATFGTTVSQSQIDNARDALTARIGGLPQPPPSLAIDDVSEAEGDAGTTTFDFTVTRTGDITGASSASFATGGGDATAGVDYISNSGAVSFAANESTKSISVTVNGDIAVEPNETFNVSLSAPNGAVLGDATGTGTIVNDDVDNGVVHRPDALIKSRSAATYKGNDIYSPATGQVSSQSIRPTKTRIFDIRVQNDGSTAEAFSLADVQPSSLGGFKMRYFSGSNEITRAVHSGEFATPTLAPGASKNYVAKVRAPLNAAPKTVKSWYIHVVSLAGHPEDKSQWVRDVVQAKVRVRS